MSRTVRRTFMDSYGNVRVWDDDDPVVRDDRPATTKEMAALYAYGYRLEESYRTNGPKYVVRFQGHEITPDNTAALVAAATVMAAWNAHKGKLVPTLHCGDFIEHDGVMLQILTAGYWNGDGFKYETQRCDRKTRESGFVETPTTTITRLNPMTMTRDQLILALEWLSEDSGTGFGICSFAGAMIWGDDRPNQSEGRFDYKSVVFVQSPASQYSMDELRVLVAFSMRQTHQYDYLGAKPGEHPDRVHRRGCNAIIIGADTWDGRRASWYRKRMSWKYGGYYSPTLPEATRVFAADIGTLAPGSWVIFNDGTTAEVVATVPVPNSERRNLAVPANGDPFEFSARSENVVFVAGSKSELDLGWKMLQEAGIFA